MSLATITSNADLDAAAIADAATRLAMLRRLSNLGMRLAEEICERAINSPYHPEPRHEPGRAFANISRAVRLTLVLQERTETKLIALRQGKALAPDVPAVVRQRAATAETDVLAEAGDHAREPSERSHETLRERESERFDEILSESFDDCVTAIRADLGLSPDQDIPADDAGVDHALQTALARSSEPASPRHAPDNVAQGHAAPDHVVATALTPPGASRPPDSG